ncbi:hypothetical protein F170042I7_20220 [Blautia caecimuris]|uniref:hypothetical protein n=1 Tax=Blautia caecimuris TaxID=1796615 RepID=UPI0034B19735
MDYTYDYTTGNLKIDYQTNMGKATTTIARPLENSPSLKSFVVKAEDFTSIKAENISPITISSDDIKNILSSHIKDYRILCPGKVVRVDFADNTSEKMVLKDPDVFDIHRCLFIAIAKHLYKDTYTPEGIEYKATLLSYEKKYAKIVNSAIKNHEKKEKEKLLKLQKEKEEKEQIKRKRARNLKRREQLHKKKIEEQIIIQKEAIIRANDEKRK